MGGATATLTDEQILDMEPDSEFGEGRNREQGSAARRETISSRVSAVACDAETLLDEAGAAQQANASSGANSAANTESQGDATADTAAQGAADEPAWLAALDAQPAAAAERAAGRRRRTT